MRTKYSIVNALSVFVVYIIKIILNFVTKTLVIKILGDAYNGIDGLFTSVVSMLSIAELGIGSAIIYNLYKPAKENNTEDVKAIISFYKKCYSTIGLIVLFIGIAIIPFIPSLIGKINIEENIIIIYLAFLVDSVFSYFYSYKQSIFVVYQQKYIINAFMFVKTLFLQGTRILALYLFRNYLLYVGFAIIYDVGVNIILTLYANKRYPFLNSRNVLPLKKSIVEDIKEKVKGLLFHKIGGYIVLGTDN